MANINLENVVVEYPALTTRKQSARVSLMHLGSGGWLAKDIKEKLKLPLTTSVMSSNIQAFNFYLKHHFFITGSEVVMHRWQHGKI